MVNYYTNPLWRAYNNQNKEEFLKYFSNNNINSGELGTLLRLAASERRGTWVKFLLELGADPKYTPEHSHLYPMYKALQHACGGEWEVLHAFQESGVSLQEISKYTHISNCSLVFAFKERNIDVANYLINNNVKVSDYKSLIEAVWSVESFNLLKDNPQVFTEEDLEKFEENKFNLLLSLS